MEVNVGNKEAKILADEAKFKKANVKPEVPLDVAQTRRPGQEVK